MPISNVEVGMKRKRTKTVFNLQSFVEGVPIGSKGPFRDSIRLFLDECCVPQGLINGMGVWLTLLKLPNEVAVPLYTIEEHVKHAFTLCDHCISCGWTWSYNFPCQRSYHLIIPEDDDWDKEISNDVFYRQNHRLHGLIHCNGFGHLLCITGLEGGSKHLRGKEIMNLWDSLCSNLHARAISVEDTSHKKCMDLRLLYAMAYRHSWFAKWDYMVLPGNVDYMEAIDMLRDMKLNDIVSHFRNSDHWSDVKKIFSRYSSLSDGKLVYLKDLFYFIVTLKNSCSIASAHAIKDVAEHTTLNTLIKSLDSAYSATRFNVAAYVIVEVLKANKADKNRRMARQDLKDAARKHIRDTGLLDHVLRHLDNVSVGSHVVHRVKIGKGFEYFIDVVGDGSRRDEEVVQGRNGDLLADVAFLYSNVLLSYPATKLVLDNKHFVKKWPFEDEKDPRKLTLEIVPCFNELDVESPPAEILVLPGYDTLMKLKEEAQKVFRDTYFVMENSVVTGIENMDELADEEELFGAIKSGALVHARFELNSYGGESGDLSYEGQSAALSHDTVNLNSDLNYEAESGAPVHERVDLNSDLNYEGGPDQWKVGDQCEDGERTLKCDLCGCWQLTRCNSNETFFMCTKCCDSIAPSTTTDKEPDSGLFRFHATEFSLDDYI